MNALLIQSVGACLAMVVGLNGLIRPLHMGKLVGLAPTNKVGLVELRVLFGSFLVVLPIVLLFKQNTELFEFFGLAALAAAIIKSSFTVLDKCPIKLIWFGILVDVVLALTLLSSFYLG